MTSVSIPIRFSPVEKFVLEELARANDMPLSTFIKSYIQANIIAKVKKSNKSDVLISKLTRLNVSKSDVDKSADYGDQFRQDFLLSRLNQN